MADRAPCYRHPRHVWIAGCADCTAWHLADLAARRDARAGGPARGRASRTRKARQRAGAG